METIASKRTQNIEEDNGNDMIPDRSLNDLPEDIIKHILTFLPTLDAVRTSMLSRQWRWRKLWHSLPSLDFIFPSNGMYNCTAIADFIAKTLEIRSGFPIQKFCFRILGDWEHYICARIDSKLDDWISYAISHNATELDIDLSNNNRYNFNFNFLNNSCVRDVKLHGGYLRHSLPSLNLDSLRSVSLSNITLTDDTDLDLISWCTNLESLVIKYCRGMRRLRICLSTLKKLSLKDCLVNGEGSSLEICCPKLIEADLEIRTGFPIQKFFFGLDSFRCDQWNWEHDICHRIGSKLEDWISYAISHKATELHIDLSNTYLYNFNFNLLNNSWVRNVRFTRGILCHSLPSLNLNSIRAVCLNGIILSDDMVVDLISWCNNLESLAIKYCHGMKSLRICSSTLKKLSLEDSEGSLLQICCPKLGSIRISRMKIEKYCIKDSASLLEANLHFSFVFFNPSDVLKWWSKVVRVLTTVKQLTTQNYFFEFMCKKDATFDGCVFENLNHLELKMGYRNCDLLGMAAFLKICPNIITLTLDFCFYNIEHDLVDKQLNIPNLKILILKNTEGMEIEKLVELIKKHGAALEKIVLCKRNGKRSLIPLQGSS